MKKLTKRINAAYQSAGLSKDGRVTLSIDEAVTKVKNCATAKFDETIEIAMKLGIDTAKSDQNVRGTIQLPNGTGKSVRVAAIVNAEKQKEAAEAGADFIGGADLATKIQGGWFDFDVAIATPDMMKEVGKLGKILGPRGLMPNPKTGTVTFDVAKAVKEFKAGKVEYRNDKAGNVHIPIGKASFGENQILENAKTAIYAVIKAKPQTAKGTYIRSATISSTMGPGVRIDLNSLKELGR